MFNNVAGDKEILYTKRVLAILYTSHRLFFILINAFIFLCVEHVGRLIILKHYKKDELYHNRIFKNLGVYSGGYLIPKTYDISPS